MSKVPHGTALHLAPYSNHSELRPAKDNGERRDRPLRGLRRRDGAEREGGFSAEKYGPYSKKLISSLSRYLVIDIYKMFYFDHSPTLIENNRDDIQPPL